MGNAPKVPTVADAKLDAGEAASLVELRLFDSNGYFATVKDEINKFKSDMTTELGWYAGDKKESDEKLSPYIEVGVDKAKEKAKDVGKAALSILIQGLSVGRIGTGPAGAAAGLLVPLITKLVESDYSPVKLEVARKPSYQVFVESLLAIVAKQHSELRNVWTKNRSEAIEQEGAEGLSRYAALIEQATEQVRQRLYTEMVGAYMAYAPQHSVNLETPHSRYTGEKQGVIDFFGMGDGARYATKFKSTEIYVEIDASSGFHTSNMRVKRTVIPELPSTVLRQLNDPNLPKDMVLAMCKLPFNRIIMEAGSSNAPARVVYDRSTSRVEPAETPHFSRMFCTQVAKAHGDRGNVTLPGQRFTTLELGGATQLYTWVVTRPFSELNFSA